MGGQAAHQAAWLGPKVPQGGLWPAYLGALETSIPFMTVRVSLYTLQEQQ